MAYSKIILNGETLMDVTSDTVDASDLLSGETATKNDGTKVTGNIATKSSSDLTVNGATVTAPAGYYNTAASKAVTTTTHPNPTAAIASSTGVVTATHTQGTGYVTGGTTTGILNLATQAAQTINTSTTDQTIASYRWLTGTQTIKSVITSNLTAANIAEGVTVKVGDANNTSRITQVTGTHSGATSYTATIFDGGNSNYCYVTYNGTKYYSNNATFNFKAGDTLTIYCRGNDLMINGEFITLSNYSYTYTLPVGDIDIYLYYSTSTSNQVIIDALVKPDGFLNITSDGSWNVYGYYWANVPTGTAVTPAKTITTNPAMTITSTTGIVTAAYAGSSSITPTITSGYVTAGTAGTVSTTGTSTFQLTSKAAATYYPSTADQTISSYRWLTGAQTIKSVTTSNLSAENIAEGVTVKVGDSNNASRITQVTGTHSGSQKHTITISGTGDSSYCYVTYKNNKYYSDFTFEYEPGDTLRIHSRAETAFLNYTQLILDSNYNYDYILPDYAGDITIKLHYSSFSQNSVYIYTSYEKFYAAANAIAINTTNGLDNDIPGFSSYIASLLNIRSGMFAERNFNSGTYIFQSASGMGYYAFNCEHRNQNVKETTFYFPNCSYIGNYAFTKRNDFKSIYFPILSSIEYGAFSLCSGLTTISFPECTTIASYAFCSCSALTLASFSKCTAISYYAFAGCRQLSKVYFPLLTSVGSMAFNQCGIISISSSDFSSCTAIDSNAFMACPSLTSVNFPKCTLISNSAFYNCYSLASVSFPECISIYTNAFYNCSALTLVSFSKCDYIGGSVFKSCKSLSNISFPSCTSIGSYAFQYCSALTSVNFPNCTSISAAAFQYCSALTSVNFPNCTYVGPSAFGNCASLTIASFSKCTSFAASVFVSCYNLISLYLIGVSSVPTLNGVAVFYSTPISTYSTVAGRYGSIFVPSSLYADFITATNWQAYSSRIVSV